MRPLPSLRPDLTWRFHAPVRPDPYVRVDTCDYSVHPDAVGLVVEVRVTQSEVTCVTKDGRVVARHARGTGSGTGVLRVRLSGAAGVRRGAGPPGGGPL